MILPQAFAVSLLVMSRRFEAKKTHKLFGVLDLQEYRADDIIWNITNVCEHCTFGQ